MRLRDTFIFPHIYSVEQGFGKPQGYKGKGKEGKGQGTDSMTLNKP
jgi:hypothetical protein